MATVLLQDLEAQLALFAEGIAGRYFHIKPSNEFSGRRLHLDPAQAALSSDTLYLPADLDAPGPASYRVLVLQQLGYREFGTLRFNVATARQRVPALARLAIPDEGRRTSDFEQFYQHVSFPGLLSRLFSITERGRITAQVLRHYPGMGRHLGALRAHLNLDDRTPDGLVDALALCVEGADPTFLVAEDASGLLGLGIELASTATAADASVYDAAAAALAIYDAWLPALTAEGASTGIPLPDAEEVEDSAVDWLQREARLEDWRDELKDLDERMLAVDLLEADEALARDGEDLTDGELRPEDVNLKTLGNERDNLARRIDMERSAIRDALGAPQAGARSYRYDEWDYLNRRYLNKWCRLYEYPLEPEDDVDLNALLRVVAVHRNEVKQQLEQIKPLGLQRVRRVADGDELDLNAVVQARQDVRARQTPDDRVYSRRERVHRDVCTAFLVDLSASTDDTIEPPQPPAAKATHPAGAVNLRDPYEDDDPYGLLDDGASQEPKRRIIDLQRESMLVMAAALEQLGDSYGIYGFSGYGHDCVEVFVAKEPQQAFTRATLQAIAAMKPKRSTRMGPAIRHTIGKLLRSGNALKVLMILSDGFPQDADYGPERGDHEYGLQDTAMALNEARAKGIETFCVTVDRSGHDYLKRMCPDARYMVIEEVEELPAALSKLYEALTG